MIEHHRDELSPITVSTIKFPEGPRWHDGRFWVSDQLGANVWQVGVDGSVQSAFMVDRPSGLGFLADGSTVVASMAESLLFRAEDGRVQPWADLRPLGGHLNDLVVDDRGRAYADLYAGDANQVGKLILIRDGAEPAVVAEDLAFPNGVAMTPDGTTLLVSETFAARITAFDVQADGALAHRRVWAEVEGMAPDGLCLDAEGAVWVASYNTGEFFRLRAGGQIVEHLSLAPRWAMACALGGADGRTLLLCSADTSTQDYFAGQSIGHLDAIHVEVPGVGCP